MSSRLRSARVRLWRERKDDTEVEAVLMFWRVRWVRLGNTSGLIMGRDGPARLDGFCEGGGGGGVMTSPKKRGVDGIGGVRFWSLAG